MVAWQDYRSGTDYDIYVKRAGYYVWPGHGVALCTAVGDQMNPMVASDGAGGAIVTWMDWRFGNADIYAQRVSRFGVPLWDGNGVLICGAVDQQQYPVIASDGAGGAIIAWADFRNGSRNDAYAQRLNGQGVVQWAEGGVQLTTAPANVWETRIVSDGAGGAIVAWIDYRGGATADIYAHHVSASGIVDATWPANGRALCTAAGQQDALAIVSDRAGGAILAWEDHRGTNWNIYAGRVSLAGAVPWAVNGVPLCSEAHDQLYPRIVTDGVGGAVVTWDDGRSDLYARRVSAAGVALWAADGVALCTAANAQFNARLVSDGSRGTIVVWADTRSNIAQADIYAQRVSPGGAPEWLANGVALTTSGSVQGELVVALDGLRGAIVSWEDYGSGTGKDIHTSRVGAAGGTGNGSTLCGAVGDQILPATVAIRAGSDVATSEDERRGTSYGRNARTVGTPTGAAVDGPPAGSGLWLSGARPNPARVGTEVRLRLPQAADVRMDVFDAGGRRVRGIPVGPQLAGEHVLRWDGRDGAGQSVATGVYFLRVDVDGKHLIRRLAVVQLM
jgi:hypothetical protein